MQNAVISVQFRSPILPSGWDTLPRQTAESPADWKERRASFFFSRYLDPARAQEDEVLLVDDAADAPQVLFDIVRCAPDTGAIHLARAQALGVCIVQGMRLMQLSEDYIKNGTIQVRALVAAVNKLRAAKGLERRFLPMVWRNDVEAYWLAPKAAAFAITRARITESHTVDLLRFGAF